MRKRVVLLVMITCLIGGLVACGLSEEEIQETEAANQAMTQEAQNVKTTLQAQFTANAQATTSIKETQLAQQTQLAQETATAEIDFAATSEVESTTAAIATGTADSIASATQLVISQQTATAQAIALATSQAQPMFNLVKDLVDLGYVETTQGNYYSLPTFDESWAQIRWYIFYPTGFAPTDFVLRAHTEWDSASQTPDPDTTGCGFVFREDGLPNHYLIYLALDGNVYLTRTYKDDFALVDKRYYGPMGIPEGEADIMLIVQGSIITYLVNGEVVMSVYDEVLKSGNLDYTLISGTNRDYGTHCQISNIELWVTR